MGPVPNRPRLLRRGLRRRPPISQLNRSAAAVAPVIREAQAAGAKSLRQIAAALNARGIATARGGKWEAATVANVLKRAAASDGADSVASQIRDASGRVKRGRSSKVR